MGYFPCRRESAIAVRDSYKGKTQKAEEEKPNTRENSSGLRSFTYEELESATDGFSSDKLLGKGSHGRVYKAVLDDGKLVAAVKKMKAALPSSSSEENNPGENEIEILSRIRSPGLVNLLGFCLELNDQKIIVVEFMANGTLYDNLHCNSRLLGWGKRVRFALQIAKAVEALHSFTPPVIHRDIKSSNVLVDEKWNARLGDFGLALRGHVEDVRMRSTPPAGTMGYLDPGYLTPQNLSAKSDVFSFGILLLEIISGRNAIDLNHRPSSVDEWALPLIKRGKFDLLYDPRIGPPKDPTVGRQLAALAAWCIRSSAERRPSMLEVVNCLKLVSNRASSTIWTNLKNQMKKSPMFKKEMDTSSMKTESIEEVPIGSKHVSSSSRSRRVSNVKSGIVFAE